MLRHEIAGRGPSEDLVAAARGSSAPPQVGDNRSLPNLDALTHGGPGYATQRDEKRTSHR